MNNPICCGVESTFVTISPTSQYYYCRECKKEVESNEFSLSPLEVARLSGLDLNAQTVAVPIKMDYPSIDAMVKVMKEIRAEEDERQFKKAVRLGLDYGMGPRKLAEKWMGPTLAKRVEGHFHDFFNPQDQCECGMTAEQFYSPPASELVQQMAEEACDVPDCICKARHDAPDLVDSTPLRSRSVSAGLYLLTILNEEIAVAPITKIPETDFDDSTWIEVDRSGHFEGDEPDNITFIPEAQ